MYRAPALRRGHRALTRAPPGEAQVGTAPVERVVVVLLLDQQEVGREPDRGARVGIAAEEAAARLRRFVAHDVVLATGTQYVGMVGVVAAEGAQAVRAEEFVRVERAPQELL